MTQKTATADVLLSMFLAKPWLFDKDTPNIQFNDYILQLNQKTNTAFYRYKNPHLFNADVLDLYKNNLIWTAPFESSVGIGYMSIFGINPNTVLISNLGVINDAMVASIDVHTNNPKNYFQFVAETKSYCMPLNNIKND